MLHRGIQQQVNDDDTPVDAHDLYPNLVAAGGLSPAEGIEVYQHAYQVRLCDTLAAHYEALHLILGDDDFSTLAEQYLMNHRPTSYTLGDFGHELCTFLHTHEYGTNAPILSELARFEWMFHKLFHEPETPPVTAQEFVALGQTNVVIDLTPSLRFQTSDYSVYQLWSHRNRDTIDLNDYNAPEKRLFLKRASGIYSVPLSDAEHALVQAIQQHGNFLQAVESIGDVGTTEVIQSTIEKLLTNGFIVAVEAA